MDVVDVQTILLSSKQMMVFGVPTTSTLHLSLHTLFLFSHDQVFRQVATYSSNLMNLVYEELLEFRSYNMTSSRSIHIVDVNAFIDKTFIHLVIKIILYWLEITKLEHRPFFLFFFWNVLIYFHVQTRLWFHNSSCSATF